MKSFILLVAIFSFQSSFAIDDWWKDTLKMNVPVEYIKWTGNNAWFGKFKEELKYNRAGYRTLWRRSSEDWGKEFNTHYRIFDESGTKCLYEYYVQDGDTAGKTIFLYNEQGFMRKSKYYSWGRFWNTIDYKCNSRGLPTELKIFIKSGEIFGDAYRYDEKGRMTAFIDTSNTSKEYFFYTYDEKGNLVKEVLLDSNWASRTTHNRDSDGNTTTTTETGLKTDDSYTKIHLYNELNQKTVTYRLDEFGDTLWRSEFTYNDQGDVTVEKGLSYEDDSFWRYAYEYKYDEYNNWIYRKEVNAMGQVNAEEKRKIKYYSD